MDTPIQTRPDNGGSWFELPQDPSTFITATRAVIPTVEPTALAEETPSKGTSPWLFATVGCIVVIVILLTFNCILWIGNRQLHKEDKSRKDAERRVAAIMRDNENRKREEEEGRRP